MFLMFNHWFYYKYLYNRYMFNFIDSYSFIPVRSCVGMGPSALNCPGPLLLLRQPCIYDNLDQSRLKLSSGNQYLSILC